MKEILIILFFIVVLIGGFIDEIIHFEEREEIRRACRGTQKFSPPRPPSPPKKL